MYITRTTMVICLTIFMSMTVSVLSGACALESERRKKGRKKKCLHCQIVKDTPLLELSPLQKRAKRKTF